MTLTTQRRCLQHLPNDPLHAIFTFADSADWQALRATNQKIRRLSLSSSLLNLYLQTHFSCTRSDTLPLPDQFDGLRLNRFHLAKPSCREIVESNQWEKSCPYEISSKGQVLVRRTDCLQLWDVKKNKLLFTFSPAEDNRFHTISGNGCWALSTRENTPQIDVWNLQNGECHTTIPEAEAEFLSAIHLSYEGNTIVLGFSDGALKIIDTNSHNTLDIQTGFLSPVNDICLSDDLTILSVAYKNGWVDLIDAKTGKKIHSLHHPSCVDFTRLARNTKQAIAIDQGGKTKVWDTKSGRCRKILQAPSVTDSCEIQVSSDGKIAILSFSNGMIKFVNFTNGKLLQTIETPQIYHLSPVSTDGTTLISGSDDFVFHFFDLARLPQDRVYDAAQAALYKPLDSKKKFEELPLFVQNEVHYHSRKQDFTSHNAKEENKRVYEGLCQYSQEAFLPGILEYFEKANSSKSEECFATAALRRVLKLPEEMQNLLYWKLTSLHKKTGQHPKNAPKNYGLLAFHNREPFSASHAERIQVIKEFLSMRTTENANKRKKQRADS